MIPNRGSSVQTPSSMLIDVHYARLNIIRRWNWDRFHRLAAFLQLTHAELASYICLRHSHLPGIESRNCFPGPAALLLTCLEAQVLSTYTKDVIAKPFPDHAPSKNPQETRPDA